MTINPGDTGATIWANGVNATLALMPTTYLPRNLTGLTGLSLADQAGDNVESYTPHRWDLRVGTAANPTAGNGPSVKISQTEKITDLATQMGGNPGDNERNAAFHVAALSLNGSLAQTCAIIGTATGAPTGTDVCAVAGWGRVTGGAGTGFGGYFEGRRDVSGARAVGAEIAIRDYGGVDGVLSPSGGSNTMGLWVSTVGGVSGQKAGAGVALGAGNAATWIAGYHASQGCVSGVTFMDESQSTAQTTLRAVGTHGTGIDLAGATFAGYAVSLPATTDSHGGISFGNDAFLYRSAAGTVRIAGALSVSGALKSDVDAGWISATLGNSWVNYGGSETTAAYRRMSDGTVRLRGSIKSGTTGAAIFTLPAGYRPAVSSREVFMAIGSAGIAEIDVMSDGTVKVAQYIASGSNAFVSLSGISFTTD